MKKYLFLILVPFLTTFGLTGCYTELLTTNATLASDNSDNTTVIYYPVPIADPAPVLPYPGHPYPIHTPKTPSNSPGNQGDIKRSETTVRNDNGGRGSVPRNTPAAPSRTRLEPANANSTNKISNTSNSSSGNRIVSANSGNNSSTRSESSNSNTVRNNNGSRNTNGGR